MIDVTCPQCEFIFKAKGNKRLIKLKVEKNRWSCPNCDTEHKGTYSNTCPTCKIDFNSKEFDDICREKGLM